MNILAKHFALVFFSLPPQVSDQLEQFSGKKWMKHSKYHTYQHQHAKCIKPAEKKNPLFISSVPLSSQAQNAFQTGFFRGTSLDCLVQYTPTSEAENELFFSADHIFPLA